MRLIRKGVFSVFKEEFVDHLIARVLETGLLLASMVMPNTVLVSIRRDFITQIISLINVINTTKVQEDQKIFIL